MGDEDLENSGSVLKLIDSLVTRIVGEHALSEGRSLAFEILLGKSRERRQQQKPIEECWICSVKLVELFKVSADHKDMLLLLDRLAYSVPHTHHQVSFVIYYSISLTLLDNRLRIFSVSVCVWEIR